MDLGVSKMPNGRMLPVLQQETSTTVTGSQSVTEHWVWTETECSQDEHNGIFEALAMTFGIAIFLTNLIVVAAIKSGGRKVHKATFYCICNLAVADMLAGLLLLWIFGLQRVILPFRTADSELVQKSVWTLTVWTSLLSQVVIAVDRYGHVTRTSFGCNKWGNKQRKRMIIVGIMLTWLIPTVTYVVPVMTVWNCANNCSCHIKNNDTDILYMRCLPLSTCSQVNPPFTKSSMLFISLVLLILPLIPVVLYFKIFMFVRNSSKNLRSSCNKNNHTLPSGSVTESSWHKKREGSGEGSSKDETSGSKTEAFVAQEDDSAPQGHHAANGGTLSESLPSKKSWRRGYMAGKVPKNKSKTTNGSAVRDSVNEYAHDEKRLRELSARSSNLKSGFYNNHMRKRNQSRDMRLLRTLVIILALFVISTVPLGLLFLVSITEMDKRYVQPAKYLLTLSLLNSLINPWVYFWRFREMRIAIRRLFCSPCASDRTMPRRKDEATCTCCHLPGGKKLHFFSSTHSSKKNGSSSSSSAF